jgi:hypothetical protein
MGRQALGEIPMLFYLLAGYFFFYVAISRSLLWLPLAVTLWGLGLITKAQSLPFWTVSLLFPLLLTLYSRQWKISRAIVTALLCSVAISQVLMWFQHAILIKTLPRAEILGLYDITALVFDLRVRKAPAVAALFMLPTLGGLCLEARRLLVKRSWAGIKSHEEIVGLMLLGLVLSWLAWYLLLSNGVIRYVFPVSFVGSLFLGKLLHVLIKSPGDRLSLDKMNGWLQGDTVGQRLLSGRFIAVLLIAASSVATLTMLYPAYFKKFDASIRDVAQYINTETPPEALIETYESEIFFLTDRPYHYPPDQVHVDLIRRTFPDGQHVQIKYDPLSANPDYLIVGEQAKWWRLYGPILQTNAFRLIRSYNRYDVYERVR